MEDGHNYTFFMSGKKYSDGYDRIFKKEKRDEKGTEDDKAGNLKGKRRKRKGNASGGTSRSKDEKQERPSDGRSGQAQLQESS